MKVILLGELRGRGGEGDVIDVATGYAVNYLLPKKLAVAATSGNLKQLEQRRHNIAKRESERLDTADKMLAALEGKTVRIAAKIGEEGQLFGSVTTAQIAEALREMHGLDIDRKHIDLKGSIKTVGEHSATVSIYRDIKAIVNVLVVDEKAAEVDAEATSDDTEADANAAEAGEETGEMTAAEALDIAADAETAPATGAELASDAVGETVDETVDAAVDVTAD